MSLSISPIYSSAGSTVAQRFIQNVPLQQVSHFLPFKFGTVTGTAGYGSSLYLHRLFVGGSMALTEIDVAMGINFANTNNGAGTMSRQFAVYSFGNSTSLATLLSFSSSSAWTTGTSTAGGSSSLTQFQGGWSQAAIVPMTFASSSLAPGDYIIGQLFDFAQANSTWSVFFYGAVAYITNGGLLNAALGTSTEAALSSIGLVAATAFTATPTSAGVLSSAGLISYGSIRLISHSNVTIGMTLGASATNGALSGLSTAATLTLTTLFSSRSNFSGSTSLSVLSNAGTGAGSFLTSSSSFVAVSSASLASNSGGFASSALPLFRYIGTGSTTSNFPSAFIAGIMSTGAVPASLALTATALTYVGSIPFKQPWFALVGS